MRKTFLKGVAAMLLVMAATPSFAAVPANGGFSPALTAEEQTAAICAVLERDVRTFRHDYLAAAQARNRPEQVAAIRRAEGLYPLALIYIGGTLPVSTLPPSPSSSMAEVAAYLDTAHQLLRQGVGVMATVLAADDPLATRLEILIVRDLAAGCSGLRLDANAN